MSNQPPFDTSRLSVTADEFKDELDCVLEYVELTSDSLNLPTPDEMFIDARAKRHWLLRYAVRFAARCASQCVTQLKSEIVEGKSTEEDSGRWH